MINVIPNQFLCVFVPFGFVFFSIRVFGVRLEMQEVGADRTIAVLETGEDDPVLHLCHFGADFNRQRIRRRAAPWRIPGPTHALAHGAGFENVRRATGTNDDGLCTEDVKIAGSDVETDGPGDSVGLRRVHQ